jgi:nitrous oxidase accessory protein NosD
VESIAPGSSRNQPAAGTPFLVTENIRLSAGEYMLPPIVPTPTGEVRGVLHVEGQNGVLVDLTGVSLRGTVAGTDLDESAGVGILVRDSSNVTIRGALIGGYKVCIQVEQSQGVIVEDVECDGWYGQRLLSTPFAENEADWLYPHDNDKGEWNAKYGAAISFTDCSDVTVRRSRGRHGQNGILLTRTNDSQVYDNDFSFLSGWGLGMYRASKNVVSHNIFDYCVRGQSEYYSRGQDSAGILMFERCCDKSSPTTARPTAETASSSSAAATRSTVLRTSAAKRTPGRRIGTCGTRTTCASRPRTRSRPLSPSTTSRS